MQCCVELCSGLQGRAKLRDGLQGRVTGVCKGLRWRARACKAVQWCAREHNDAQRLARACEAARWFAPVRNEGVRGRAMACEGVQSCAILCNGVTAREGVPRRATPRRRVSPSHPRVQTPPRAPVPVPRPSHEAAAKLTRRRVRRPAKRARNVRGAWGVACGGGVRGGVRGWRARGVRGVAPL